MRLSKTLGILLLVAVAVGASGAGKKEKTAAPPNQVDMPFLVAPVSKNDTLAGFHYLSYRLVTPAPTDAADVKLKLAILQDAFVRDVYKNPVAHPDTPEELDRAALHDRLIAIARRIVGAKKVVDLVYLDVKFAPLHPKPGAGPFVPETANAPAGKVTGIISPDAEKTEKSKQKEH